MFPEWEGRKLDSENHQNFLNAWGSHFLPRANSRTWHRWSNGSGFRVKGLRKWLWNLPQWLRISIVARHTSKMCIHSSLEIPLCETIRGSLDCLVVTKILETQIPLDAYSEKLRARHGIRLRERALLWSTELKRGGNKKSSLISDMEM